MDLRAEIGATTLQHTRAQTKTRTDTQTAALRRDTVSLSLAVLAGLLTFIKDSLHGLIISSPSVSVHRHPTAAWLAPPGVGAVKTMG